MAVVSVKPKYGSGQGKAEWERKNAFTLELLVWVDDVNDGPAVVLQSASVPKVGDVYSTGNDYDPGSFCKSVVPVRDTTVEKLFHVICEYDNEEPDVDTTTPPLLRPATFDWSNRREEFFFPVDTRGNHYVTPAGVPLENPPATPIHLLVLTITKNVASYNPVVMNGYADAVNLTTFLGFAAGYAKIEDISPSKLQHETINGVHYQFYTMETVVAFRRIAWHPHYIVAKGRQYKNGSGDLVPSSADGVLTDHEEFLDAAGEKTTAAGAYLIPRYPFPELNFAGIAQFTGITPGW